MMNLCLVHGWGVNHHIFDEFKTWLPESWHVSAPDLWGHGADTSRTDFPIDEVITRLSEQVSPSSVVVGWSLGALLSLLLTVRYPEKVKALVLISGFARFRPDEDYLEGVQSQALAKMAMLFKRDYALYVRQFIELQLLNTPERRFIIDDICDGVVKSGCPPVVDVALKRVDEADVRGILPRIRCPSLVLCGNRDTVTPVGMSEYLVRHLPRARLEIVDGAAHAPFLSHAEVCANLLSTFVQTVYMERGIVNGLR